MSRPRFWFYLAGPVVVGVSYGASEVGDLITANTIVLFLYFLIPANIYLYGINDIFDRDIDELNPKKSEDGPEVQYRKNRFVDTIIIISGLMGFVFLYMLPVKSWFGIVGFLLLGLLYSTPPVRLKTKPFFDSISNGLYILPSISVYIYLADTIPNITLILGAWIWSMSMHTFSAIPDIKSDAESGIQTTATYLGKRKTLLYCFVLWLISSILFTINHVFFLILLIYPLLIVVFKINDSDISKVYWWYPYINFILGMILSMGGIYTIIY